MDKKVWCIRCQGHGCKAKYSCLNWTQEPEMHSKKEEIKRPVDEPKDCGYYRNQVIERGR